jgi:hypothetical protein
MARVPLNREGKGMTFFPELAAVLCGVRFQLIERIEA